MYNLLACRFFLKIGEPTTRMYTYLQYVQYYVSVPKSLSALVGIVGDCRFLSLPYLMDFLNIRLLRIHMYLYTQDFPYAFRTRCQRVDSN